jgi:hypothetical protein
MAARPTTDRSEKKIAMNMWDVCKEWCRDAQRNGQGHMVSAILLGYWVGQTRQARRRVVELEEQLRGN